MMVDNIGVWFFSILFSACFSIAAFADVFTWNSQSQGGWADPASYVDNNGDDIPGEGDIVKIPNDTVVMVTDEDIPVVKDLHAVMTLGDQAKVVFDVSGDHEINCSICGTENGTSDSGNGNIVKNGKGSIWLKKSSSLWNYYIHITVNDGILKLPATTYSNRNQTYRSLRVNKPGVLYTTVNSETPVKTVHFRARLYGDGMVTNPSNQTVIFYPTCQDVKNIPGFSGTLCGKIRMSGMDGFSYQNFTGTGSVNPEHINVNANAHFGIADLGGTSADGQIHYGSFGNGKVVFDGEGVLKYLGDGQTAYTRFEDYNNLKVAHIDAGEKGGLRLLGTFAFDKSTNTLIRMMLSGDNLNPCSIEGAMYNKEDGAVYLTKKGTGTWSLASETAFSNGVIAVENGTLKFTSIRNRGLRCSLGSATVLRSEHTGAISDSQPLPYAYLLGTEETAGTMEYIGESAAVCDDRAFAIKGSGRIISSGGSIVLSGGVGSVLPGDNTLCLGGGASGCVMNNVTDGAGVLKVVKEGAGDWSLGGNLDFSGGIEVKAGRLRIGHEYVHQSRNYSFYRLTIREKNAGGSGNSYFTIGRLALFNEAGEVQNAGLEYNPAANSNGGRSLLDPGQFAYSFTNGNRDPNLFFNDTAKEGGVTVTRDNPMYNATNIFSALEADVDAFARFRHKGREGTSYWPSLNEESYWPSIDFRLPLGTDKVVAYDIGARYGMPSAGSSKGVTNNWKDVVGSWTLYGSVDGENWTELSSVTSNSLRGVKTTDHSWLYDGTSYKTAEGWKRHISGWTIHSQPADSHVPEYSQFANGLGKISVNPGAVLRTTDSHEIDELKLGPENGTIDGFSFADSGTLEVSGVGDSERVILAVTFLNAKNLQYLKKWTVDCKERKMQVVKVDENGVTLSLIGLKVIVR